MNPFSITPTKDSILVAPERTFSLGFREFLFLALILFFGFCGFTVCVKTIYTSELKPEIDAITVYDKDFTYNHRSPRQRSVNYSLDKVSFE